MKPIHRVLCVILLIGICGVVLVIFLKEPGSKVTNPTVAGPLSRESGGVSIPSPVPTKALPTRVGYEPVTPANHAEDLVSVLGAVSNAVLSVDRILKSKNYKVEEFSRTVWLVAEDKVQSTVWKIFPYKTNAVVGSVEAVVYQDAGMTQKDPARSFQMSFYPETGALRNFSWGDKHEVLFIQTNGACDYGRDVGGKIGLIMRWDEKGNLTFSNAYDRTRLGKPIGLPQQVEKTPYRLGPTSAVEAATESWRRKAE